MGNLKLLSKRLEMMESRVIEDKYEFAVVVRSVEEIEANKQRIGPKTKVIHIKKATKRIGVLS